MPENENDRTSPKEWKESQTEPASSTKDCPGCGTTIESDATECPVCNRKFAQESVSPPIIASTPIQTPAREGARVAEPIHKPFRARKVNSVRERHLHETESMDTFFEENGSQRRSKENPVKEVERRFFQPNIEYIQSFIVLILFLASIGFILEFTLLKDTWYEYFNLYNAYLMIVTAIGIIVAFYILLKSKPEAPPKVYGSRQRTIVGYIGMVVGIITFICLALFGKSIGQWNFVVNIILAICVLAIVGMSPTIPKDELAKIGLAYAGILMLLTIPVHEAFGPFQTEFRSIPWSTGNELLVIFGTMLVIAAFAALKYNTSFLAIWLFGALVLFLVPFHEITGIIASGNYEPWDHTVAIIGMVICASGSVGFLSKKKQYEGMAKSIGEGNDHFQKEEYEKALESYDRALSTAVSTNLVMQYSTPWHSSGDALARMGKIEDALSRYNIALSIEPEDVITWMNKGNCLAQLGRPSEALESYSRAVTIDPSFVEAWLAKALLEKAMGNFEDAEISYNRVINLEPRETEAWLGLGQIMRLMGEYEQALVYLNRGECLGRGVVDIWLEKIRIYREIDEEDNAKELINNVIMHEPNNPYANYEAASIFYKHRAFKTAERYLNKTNLEHEFMARVLRTKLSMELDNPEETLELVHALENDFGPRPEIYHLRTKARAHLLRKKENIAYAEGTTGSEMELALSTYRNKDAMRITQIIGIFSKPGFQNALMHIENQQMTMGIADGPRVQAIQAMLFSDFKESPEIMMIVAIGEDIRKARFKAISQYREAVQMSSGILLLPEFVDDALAEYELALAIYPRHPEIVIAKCELLLRLGKYEDCIASAEDGFLAAGRVKGLLNLRGLALMNLRQYGGAMTMFKECLHKDGHYYDAWFNMGNAYAKLEDIDSALACFNNVLHITPNHALAIKNRNLCLKSKLIGNTVNTVNDIAAPDRHAQLNKDELSAQAVNPTISRK